MDQRPLDTAAAYAGLGLRVIPLCSPSCGCKAPGKVPWDPIARHHMVGWQQSGVPTSDKLDAWCAAPGADRLNLGCLTGHGLAWLDVDGPEGEEQLQAILGPEPPATWEFRRGHSSRRLIYAVPDGLRVPTIGGDAGHAGLRILGEAAQSVVPPSRHKSGDFYMWVAGRDPWTFGPATAAPAALLQPLRAHAAKGSPINTVTETTAFTLPPGVDVADLTARVRELLPAHLRDVLDRGPEACPGRYPSRSEAIFALVGSLMANGVHDEVGAVVLAGRPWIAARYGRDALSGLLREFTRARQKGSQAWYVPADLRLTLPLKPAASQVDPEPPTAAEAPRAIAGSVERSAVDAEKGPVRRPFIPDPTYTRRGTRWWATVRLRTFDQNRDQAVRDGLDAMAALLHGSATLNDQRMAKHINRLLRSFDRCRTEAWANHHEVRGRSTRRGRGDAYLWSDEPCDGRGHEDCAPYHALREIGETWGEALDVAYPDPITVLALLAPGWGLKKTRQAVGDLLHAAAVKAALPMACGFLIADGAGGAGYGFHVLVPQARAGEAARVLLREWRNRVPCGWVRHLNDLPPACTALEAMVDLRVRSEQALPLLTSSQAILLPRTVAMYAVETGISSGSERGGQLHRIVIGAGLRALRKDLRQQAKERVSHALAQAAGAEYLAGVAEVAAAQGVAGSTPSESGIPPHLCTGIHDSPGAGTPDAGGTGTPGASASAGDDDGGGWMPAPWDPNLEIRRSRDRKRGPASLPWYVLERMARDGEAEPVVVNGRIIGYVVPRGARVPQEDSWEDDDPHGQA